MKIHNIITSFRGRRARRLAEGDSVSFEAFCNDSPTDVRYPQNKQTAFDISPVKNKNPSYLKYSRQDDYSSSRPSLSTILLFIVLSAVFLILPIIYLLNCFDIIYEHRQLKHNPIVTDAEQYEPNLHLHNAFMETRDVKLFDDLPNPPKPDYTQCSILRNEDKFDCYPEGVNVTQDSCEQRGCCWQPVNTAINEGFDVPYCFYPPNYETYKYINVSETGFGLVAFLNRTYASGYPDDVRTLQMIVKYETENRLRVKFIDPTNARYETSYPEVPVIDNAAVNRNYILELDMFQPGFKVVRKSDNTTIFDSNSFLSFTYADQFLQLGAKLPSNYIYGIGEHTSNLLLSTQWQTYTMFNSDQIPAPNQNLYGSHPFYLVMENSGNSHGVFLLNTNAMEILLQPAPAVTFRTLGGVLDFYFFIGPAPTDVIAQYTDLIGHPYMPPFWALGFHLCRFGIGSLNNTKEVMERNIAAGIPLDTQWNDLDYMDSRNDFSYDKDKFAGLPDFVDDLHSRGMHYTIIVDPGVSAGEDPGTYPPYDEGIKMDIFVKNSTGQPFIGKVWNPVSTVWPDFTHPNAVDYWTLMLKTFHDEVPFDGAWIDMNEPSNFLDGQADGCPDSPLESPPYVPPLQGDKLQRKTLCMTAKQYASEHYNVHNIYGFTEAIVTNFAMAEIRGKRQLIISRSTFSGHGYYAGHWSGDVSSSWDSLKQSIPHLLSFSLYGISLMGADICGFNGDTTAALCNRWQQLGAFYPFSRNHNTDSAIDQDPAALGDLVVASTKKALSARYSLLPFLYTLFYRAHATGETVARPLFFEYPLDQNTYNIDTQFLWGPALMIVPALEDSTLWVSAYLPKDLWYDFYDRSVIESSGQYVNLSAPIDTIPLLVRGGYVLPQQDPKQTTTDTRKTNIELLVASDGNGEAYGELFWDDGDSLNTVEEKRYSLISFELENNTLRTNNAVYEEDVPNLGTVTVLGVQSSVTQVEVNNANHSFSYNTVNKYLVIDELDVSFEKSIVISWK